MITVQQEIQIRQLRNQGSGYKKIAALLNLTRDSVRYYCKKNSLDSPCDVFMPKPSRIPEYNEKCKYCGANLEQPKTGRKRYFCCGVCRDTWWKENRAMIHQNSNSVYHFTCKRCGKEFTAYGNSNRQYCSRECYIGKRYWDGKKPTGTIAGSDKAEPVVTLLY